MTGTVAAQGLAYLARPLLTRLFTPEAFGVLGFYLASLAGTARVMRYAGPRMLWRHPLLAIRHLWIERQGAPPWPPRRRRKAARPPLSEAAR